MRQRIWQFLHTLNASLSMEDRCFVATYLPSELQKFFWGMSVVDQCHALRVARTAIQLARKNNFDGKLDEGLLIRGSLLHDIGRQKGDMSIMGKVLSVLCYAAFPRQSIRWATAGDAYWFAGLRHILYISSSHPALGAQWLRQAGFAREAVLVAGHHKAPAESDSPELLLLRAADAMN